MQIFGTGPRLVAVLTIGLVQAACEPCAGVPSCTTTPSEVRVTGHFIDFSSGEPVEGVVVQFRRAGGVEMPSGSFSATTGPDGFYTARAEASDAGEVVLSVTVSPPGHPPYEVDDVRAPASPVRGEGTDLGRWVVDPYVAFVGEVRHRRTGEPLVAGGRVTFERTGGAAIATDEVQTVLDPSGRFLLAPRALEPGVVVGDLTIRHSHLERTRVVEGLTLQTRHVDAPIELTSIIGAGPSLDYVGEVLLRGSDPKAPPEGTRVVFERTGGIPITPDSVVEETTSWGAFSVNPTPSRYGEVVGDITIHLPPPRETVVISDVRLETFDTDGQRLIERWTVGPSLAYVGEVQLRTERTGFPMSDVEVEFRRTDGIPVEHGDRTPLTDWGAFAFDVFPLEDGEVEGQVVLHFPDPHPPIHLPDTVTLETFRSDEQRFAGRWSAGPSLRYLGELYRRSGGQQHPLPGAEVRVRRTGGIPISPEEFVVTTTDWGALSLGAFTSTPGEVELELIVDLPAPQGTDTIRGVTLSTFDGVEHRLGGRWGAGGQINYAVGLFDSDTQEGIPDLEVRVERTGGIAVEPDTFTVKTTSWGAFSIQVHTEEEGELIVDFVVMHPDGTVRIPDVRIPTFRTDEYRLLGWFGL